MADRPELPNQLDVLTERAARHLTPDEARALREQITDLRADLERARDVAVALENETARLEHYAAIDKEVKEKADRECDEHIAAGREFRKWGEECRRVGARYWLAWKSARQRAQAYRESILRLCEDRDSWKGWMWEQAARADRAEQRLDGVLAEHTKFVLKAGERIGQADALAELRRRNLDAETARAERAEQQLAEVRALAADMRNWCSPRGIAADYATRIEETLARAAARDDAQQPSRDCPACEVGIDHTEHCPTPETHNWGCGCPGAQPARQDGHAGACGPLTAPDDPESAEPAIGRQAGVQRRCPCCGGPKPDSTYL